MARVAFIGLGNMGGGMAANLAKNGHDVRAFDLSDEALAKAKAAGCLPMTSAAEAVDGVEAVITMLPAGKHVDSVYTDAVFGHAPASAILIDCSTIDVATAKQVADAARGQGADGGRRAGFGRDRRGECGYADLHGRGQRRCLRARVGVPRGYGQGGDPRRAERRWPGREDLQQHDPGRDDGRRRARRSCSPKSWGSAPQAFYDIASVSSGQSWSMTSYCPMPGVGPDTPADHDYQGGFAAALMLKDLRLAMAAAADVGATTPMGARRARPVRTRSPTRGRAGSIFPGSSRCCGTPPPRTDRSPATGLCLVPRQGLCPVPRQGLCPVSGSRYTGGRRGILQ